MPDGDVARRIREICLTLPGTTERQSHGAPAFFVGKQYAQVWPDGHHDHRFPHLWCAAPPGVQEALITDSPGRYFRPPYVGGRGWIGVRLDGAVDWDEVVEVLEDAYRCTAPARLVSELDGQD